VEEWETVMTIEGDYADFAHLETLYLGALARQSRIATNVRNVVKAANGKPVLFFPARYDIYQTQESDGYA
ncbi:nicotinate phosphoribosyltransferase, partial [gut metagenome]